MNSAGLAVPGLSPKAPRMIRAGRWIAGGLIGGMIWWLVYGQLARVAHWLTFSMFRLEIGSHLGSAVEFFIYEVPKVLMLLTLVVFGVGIIRSFFTPERTRRILSGRRESAGNVLAALLGIVTPFCSCSAVPLFIGFVTTGVPLGVTFSFLISAPMVNEVALVLLFGLFGWKVAGLYLGTGLFIAIIAGWVLGRLRLERYVEDWVYATKTGAAREDEALDWPARLRLGGEAVRDIVGRVWIYVMLGIAVGAGIHGYVPENFGYSRILVGVTWDRVYDPRTTFGGTGLRLRLRRQASGKEEAQGRRGLSRAAWRSGSEDGKIILGEPGGPGGSGGPLRPVAGHQVAVAGAAGGPSAAGEPGGVGRGA